MKRWTIFYISLFLLIGVFPLFSCVMLTRPFVIQFSKSESRVKADSDRLKAYTKKLSTEFVPRDYKNIENLDKAADWIASEFRKNSQDVSFQEYEVEGKKYKNVISSYLPTVGKNAKTIIVGAHYDACKEYPGADDNASGIAGLLELSRLIAENPVPYKVILLAYTLEEPPFFATPYMGSVIHAQSIRNSEENVKLMISLEMIGYFVDSPDSQNYPSSFLGLLYPDIGNFIAVVGPMSLSSATLDLKAAILRATDLPTYSINAPSSLSGIDFSDHRSYWAEGIDAVMVTDTSFFRNYAYHTAEDTFERLDYHKMAKVVSGVYAYLASY